MRKRRHRTDDDIFDEMGLIRDGATYRRGMQFMDSKSTTDSKPAVLDSSLHRPGWRMTPADKLNLADREAAHLEHLAYLNNSWRDAGEGIRGGEGTSCTVRGQSYPEHFGEPGIVRGGKCVPVSLLKSDDDDDDDTQRATSDARRRRKEEPDQPDADEGFDEGCEGTRVNTMYSNTAAGVEGVRAPRPPRDAASLKRLSNSHQDAMSELYSARDAETASAWKQGK
jgi:hypothetical protein